MQEHEVEVRPVAELEAAELAVGHDDHARRPERRLTRTAARRAVPRRDLSPRERQCLADDELRDVGEPVAHLHERQASGEVRHGDTEHRGTLELSQEIDLSLGVVAARTAHARAQVALELGPRRRRIEEPVVEQLIEQERERGDLVGEELRVRAQFDEAPAHHRVLVEQGEIDGTAADALRDVQHAPERDGLARVPGDGLQQPWQQRVQATPTGLVEAAVIGALAQHVEPREHRGRVAQARRPQQFDALVRVETRLEQRPERAQLRVARLRRHGTQDDAREMRTDPGAMSRDLRVECGPVLRAHRECEARPAGLVVGQLVGLLVVALLQAVLDPPQESVRLAELRNGSGRQELLALEERQRLEQAPRLQARVGAAADQLVGLHDELDLADAARPELHVVAQVAALDLARDQLLHPAQRLEHAEVQVAAIDEGTQDVAVDLVESARTVHRPCLDVGIALPVAPVLLQVVLERIEAHHRGARVAERAQPQVHAVDEAFVGPRAEELRQAPPDADEVLLVRERSQPVGFAVLRKEQNEVDVGGEVELAAAELAHAEHEQFELASVGAAGPAVPCRESLGRADTRRMDARVGEQRELAQHGLDVREAREVAPGDSNHPAAPKATQGIHERAVIGERIEVRGELAFERVRADRLVEPAGCAEPRQQGRIAQAGIGHEIAACPDHGQAPREGSARERVGERRIGCARSNVAAVEGGRCALQAGGLPEARQALLERRAQDFRYRRQVERHRPPSGT